MAKMRTTVRKIVDKRTNVWYNMVTVREKPIKKEGGGHMNVPYKRKSEERRSHDGVIA